jgi:hypothetical protein
MKILGLDFGSKLAGATAVCFDSGGLRFEQSLKGKDADALSWRYWTCCSLPEYLWMRH